MGSIGGLAVASKKPKDAHKSGFMVRLPLAYRPALEALKAKNRRPITMELQIAIDAYLKTQGVPVPVAA